ncbi:uncharacterized protein LOC127351090 [Xyrichtys novacula]|uniref:Uncharacterized protein LOC127351090 n=1 Tax=Xyrichtys novacula TaxID=13765 RepID=A0AAV1ELA7_XYRNO|nr:uncharacterized protein LOC127351090 [Xyrichtys novacula]
MQHSHSFHGLQSVINTHLQGRRTGRAPSKHVVKKITHDTGQKVNGGFYQTKPQRCKRLSTPPIELTRSRAVKLSC